jgi:hypothetical protein
MKKLLIPAVVMAMFMASCADVKSDADKICAKLTQIVDAEKANDAAKIETLEKELTAEMDELKKKYPAGSEEAKKLDAIVNPCTEDAKKARIKANAATVCDMMTKMMEAQKTNDSAKIEALQQEMEPKLTAMQKKYPSGSDDEKQLEELVKPCMEELMKAALESSMESIE